MYTGRLGHTLSVHWIVYVSAGVGNTFIELYNPGAEAMALGGCTVTSKKGVTYTFPQTAALPPGQHLLLRSIVCTLWLLDVIYMSHISRDLSFMPGQLYTGSNTTPYQFTGRLGAHDDVITVACGDKVMDQVRT
jgi:hypothetical protein